MKKRSLTLSMVLTITLLYANDATVGSGVDGKDKGVIPIESLFEKSGAEIFDRVSIGGYGKVDYTNYLDKEGSDQIDIYRLILYFGYRFSDEVKFVSEIEWEHGGTENSGGYSVVEQAYIDFKVTELLNIKVGHHILPVGVVNLYHEPTSFYPVQRPETEKYIIPSTWHENGVIVYGKSGSLSYQAGVVAGLNGVDESGNAIKTIRKMRQRGQLSKAEDFAFVGRLDYFAGDFSIGTSYFGGEADQGVKGVEMTANVAEAHARWHRAGFVVEALYAINRIEGNQGTDIKGRGYYVVGAYHFDTIASFVQYEAYTTDEEKEMITIATLGLNYKPVNGVVLKADYSFYDRRGVDDDRFALSVGWAF